MIYEGANGVQAWSASGGSCRRTAAAPIMAFFGEVGQFLAANKDDAALAPYLAGGADRARPSAAGDDVADRRTASPIRTTPAPASTDYMHLFGLTALGYMWARIVKAVLARQAKGDSNPALDAKLIARQVLRRAYAAGDARRIWRAVSAPARRPLMALPGGGVLGRTATGTRRRSDEPARRRFGLTGRLPVRRRALPSDGRAAPGENLCHCRMCQKASGGPFMAFAGVSVANLVCTRGVAESLRKLGHRRARASAPTAARR